MRCHLTSDLRDPAANAWRPHVDPDPERREMRVLMHANRIQRRLRNERHHRSRAVVCLTTGERFDTLSDAAWAHRCNVADITKAIRRGGKAHGLRFAYADDAAEVAA